MPVRLSSGLFAAALISAAATVSVPQAAPFSDVKPAGDPAAAIPRPPIPMAREAMRAFRDKEFDVTDTDHDGYLTLEEIKARLVASTGTWSPNRLAIGFRHNCGFDGDRCDRAQFRQAGYAEFDTADTNHDALLTLRELKARAAAPDFEQPY